MPPMRKKNDDDGGKRRADNVHLPASEMRRRRHLSRSRPDESAGNSQESWPTWPRSWPRPWPKPLVVPLPPRPPSWFRSPPGKHFRGAHTRHAREHTQEHTPPADDKKREDNKAKNPARTVFPFSFCSFFSDRKHHTTGLTEDGETGRGEHCFLHTHPHTTSFLLADWTHASVALLYVCVSVVGGFVSSHRRRRTSRTGGKADKRTGHRLWNWPGNRHPSPPDGSRYRPVPHVVEAV